jgi:hypothetical protein
MVRDDGPKEPMAKADSSATPQNDDLTRNPPFKRGIDAPKSPLTPAFPTKTLDFPNEIPV